MPLAKPGDPYVSRQGEVALPSDAFPPKADITIGPAVARNIQSTLRRSIGDMPAEPRTQTAMNVVLVYSMLGLTENEIAHVVGVSLEDVKKLKMLDHYQETFELLFHEMISINSNSMQSKIAAFAPVALESIMSIAQTGKHEVAKLKASQDILDRSGLHHETLYGTKNDGGFESLKIVIQEGEDKSSSIDIDIRKK